MAGNLFSSLLTLQEFATFPTSYKPCSGWQTSIFLTHLAVAGNLPRRHGQLHRGAPRGGRGCQGGDGNTLHQVKNNQCFHPCPFRLLEVPLIKQVLDELKAPTNANLRSILSKACLFLLIYNPCCPKPQSLFDTKLHL